MTYKYRNCVLLPVSTDDDKIVKYQWEVLEVPIGYSVQLNETPTLQLKNLIPGLYRFK